MKRDPTGPRFNEMFQAFLLEREYTKEEILEMYTNQFFVNGYGKGLKIAAQYFFDKDPQDLNLVEVAFIVGSVKGPNKYNPFIRKTLNGRKRERKTSGQGAKGLRAGQNARTELHQHQRISSGKGTARPLQGRSDYLSA